MTSRIAANMPPMPTGRAPGSGGLELPEFLHEPFAAAMSEAMLLPAFIALFGVAAALFMVGFVSTPARRTAGLIDHLDDLDDLEELDEFNDLDEPGAGRPGGPRRERVSLPSRFAVFQAPRDVDQPTEPIPIVAPRGRDAGRGVPREVQREDPATEPLTVEIPKAWMPPPEPESIPVIRNGFQTDGERHFRPLVHGSSVPDVLAKFGISGQASVRRNRHYREEPDDTDRIGRHSYRERRG